MKRLLASVLAALAAATALLASLNGETAITAATEPYSALRLHILADSDSERDQAAKLAVRDAVLEVINNAVSARRISSSAEARELMKAIGAELQQAAENVLKSFGMDYGVQLLCGEFDFPDRVYGSTLYPAGRYSALRIILGRGLGHNWWCVMFPPLCIIDSAASPARYNEDGTLEFKSIFSELISRIFGGGRL